MKAFRVKPQQRGINVQFLISIVTLIVVWKFLVLVWYICAWLVIVVLLGLLRVAKLAEVMIRAVRGVFELPPKSSPAANILKFKRRM